MAETYEDYNLGEEYSDEYVSYSDLYDMDEASGIDPKVLAITTKAAGKIPLAGELVGILDPMIYYEDIPEYDVPEEDIPVVFYEDIFD